MAFDHHLALTLLDDFDILLQMHISMSPFATDGRMMIYNSSGYMCSVPENGCK